MHQSKEDRDNKKNLSSSPQTPLNIIQTPISNDFNNKPVQNSQQSIQSASSFNSNNSGPYLAQNLAVNFNNLRLLEPEKFSNLKMIQNNSRITHLTADNSKKVLLPLDLFNDSSSLDPFNDMDLKTLNDLEELKQILQNQNSVQTTASDSVLNQQNYNSSLIPDSKLKHYQGIENGAINNPVQLNTSQQIINKPYALMDNFGLPKVSFIDLDANMNKL